ncbi:hypothetical protein M433DRAFT_376390 [Acidomyces richmondensis BFW]|nr:MAG: hypothetical protein FE78DRAFT_287185 [Acidomyces sp. 'richmondensis']KYG48845.1 hypothetical protein M433DRAFT_376390 [Acidomyces richmondensis BFW]
MAKLAVISLFLSSASSAYAQFGSYGGGNPFSNGNPFDGPPGISGLDGFGPPYPIIVTAHAVLATVAFGLLFPVGGIVVRLASFPGLWWVHGVFQLFGYLLFVAAAVAGLFLATQLKLMNQAHPIIGIMLLLVLLFQPLLGFIHHTMFKRHSRRVVWSYGHIWLGRAAITVGIINGGLGLQLARRTAFFPPQKSTIIGYSVAAGIIWFVYILSAFVGEARRRQKAKYDFMAPPPYHHRRRRIWIEFVERYSRIKW